MANGWQRALVNLFFYGPLFGGWRPYLRGWLEFTGIGGGHWLDVCGGDLNLIRALAEAAPETSFVSIDLALPPAATDGALPDNLTLIRADAAALPFTAASFDVVLISMGLHHLPPEARRAALAEAYRVLGDGGRLYVLEYQLPRRGPARWQAAYYVRIDSSPHAWPLARGGSLQWEIEDAGFEIKRQAVTVRGVLVRLEAVKRSGRTSR